MRTPAEVLASRIESGEIPSASWLVAESGRPIASGAAGFAVLDPSRVPAAAGTLYDLASLTKPLVTSLLALILRREAGIDLGAPVRRFLPSFESLDKREITLSHLLTHTSGLPAWAPLYVHGASIGEYLLRIGGMEPLAKPGGQVLYSDLGYIALGAALERIGGGPLDVLAGELILAPAGVEARFRPGAELLNRVAATEASCNYERGMAGSEAAGYTGWRTGVIRGEVHDQNAWAAGGVAGHAGLFGTAMDVLRLARELTGPEPTLLRDDDLPLALVIQTGSLPTPRSLAWRINRAAGGGPDPQTAAGEALPATAAGHNGFTGTSVWTDPERGRAYVLLTNRVHPEVRTRPDMNALRREFHLAAAAVPGS